MNNRKNLRMHEKLAQDKVIDVSKRPLNEDGDYILDEVADGLDYCNAETEQWIWSIGQHKDTGQILASHTAKFYQNPDYTCLWLR